MYSLHLDMKFNNPIIVELLLKEYDANTNVVNNKNQTTLLYLASKKDRNLSILILLVNSRFEPGDQHASWMFMDVCVAINQQIYERRVFEQDYVITPAVKPIF